MPRGRTTWWWFAGTLALAACSNGGGRARDAGAGGAAGSEGGGAGGGSAGGVAAGGAGGAGGQGPACVLDAGALDWFAGVWSGVQFGETYVVTNRSGCSRWEGSVNGVVCDSCIGAYGVTDATTGALTLDCMPVSGCSASPVHMDVGTIARSGCTFVYDYQYTGPSPGTATFTGPNRLGDALADVCLTGGANPPR